jgi:hypothetical protein
MADLVWCLPENIEHGLEPNGSKLRAWRRHSRGDGRFD